MQLFVDLRPAGGLRALQASPEASVLSVVLEALADGPSCSSRCDGQSSALFGRGDQRIVSAGRTLSPYESLAGAEVLPGATLQLLPRLRGGGGDGGATGAESRSCYLEMYLGKKPDKVRKAR